MFIDFYCVLRPGMSVEVYIEHVDTANKKLALSMLPAGQQRTDPSAAHLHSVEKGLAELKRIPPQRWLQGVVQRTTAAGLYVRLANRDAIGKRYWLYNTSVQSMLP